MIHNLKAWPGPFVAVIGGSKRHEIRRDDRGYAVGDRLVLNEWDPSTKEYTGRMAVALVTYLTPGGEWGLPADLCVMSILVAP